MLETEDCTPKFWNPEVDGAYLLQVVSVGPKVMAGTGYKRQWEFNVSSEKLGIKDMTWTKSFFPSQVKELLLALDGKCSAGDPNKIEIDYEKVPGMCVSCIITITPGKDPKYPNYTFSNAKSEVPF